MFCTKCGNANAEAERFCRKCGADLRELSLERSLPSDSSSVATLAVRPTPDPDEMTGRGIGRVIIGDGFLMVAVILAATQSAVSSLLWLFLLIPAFFFFGKGFADVLHARQLRHRMRQKELNESGSSPELPPSRFPPIETFEKVISGELTPVPSVTERTTRNLN